MLFATNVVLDSGVSLHQLAVAVGLIFDQKNLVLFIKTKDNACLESLNKKDISEVIEENDDLQEYLKRNNMHKRKLHVYTGSENMDLSSSVRVEPSPASKEKGIEDLIIAKQLPTPDGIIDFFSNEDQNYYSKIFPKRKSHWDSIILQQNISLELPKKPKEDPAKKSPMTISDVSPGSVVREGVDNREINISKNIFVGLKGEPVSNTVPESSDSSSRDVSHITLRDAEKLDTSEELRPVLSHLQKNTEGINASKNIFSDSKGKSVSNTIPNNNMKVFAIPKVGSKVKSISENKTLPLKNSLLVKPPTKEEIEKKAKQLEEESIKQILKERANETYYLGKEEIDKLKIPLKTGTYSLEEIFKSYIQRPSTAINTFSCYTVKNNTPENRKRFQDALKKDSDLLFIQMSKLEKEKLRKIEEEIVPASPSNGNSYIFDKEKAEELGLQPNNVYSFKEIVTNPSLLQKTPSSSLEITISKIGTGLAKYNTRYNANNSSFLRSFTGGKSLSSSMVVEDMNSAFISESLSIRLDYLIHPFQQNQTELANHFLEQVRPLFSHEEYKYSSPQTTESVYISPVVSDNRSITNDLENFTLNLITSSTQEDDQSDLKQDNEAEVES